MKVTKKELSKTEVELTIELDSAEVQPFVEKAAKRISQEVSIKGFRKGKVPYDLLKQHVGEAAIYEEAFNDMVEDSYPKAVTQEKLQVVGRAKIDVEKVAPGNPIVYKATVPLMPKVVLGEYKKINARKQAVKMDEKKYERTLQDLRRMRAKEKLVTREAKEGDKILADFDVKVGGVPIEGGKGIKQEILIGDHRFIPGFEEQLVGMKKDEEKTFELQFPKEYKKDLAEKKAEFQVKVHDVYEIELPELNDALAKELNFETLTQLQEEIKANITRELEQAEQEKFELAVVKELIEKSNFDPIPDQLIDEESNKMMHELEHDVTKQNLKFDDYLAHIKKTKEDLKKDFHDKAEERIKAALVMREIAVVEKIIAESSEVDKEINDLKKMYEHVPDAAAEIESPQQRARMENVILHRKTIERLESFAK
ncbi:MAG TPA: trigger factor [Patescibacteria group bacterium]|nr:trigger factor [Patescibacteria group bacterium]